MAIKDGLTASQRLPIEIVVPICVLAAENDRRCANNMAFVTKKICMRTANARWTTIAITSIRHFFAFFKIVHAIPDELYDRCMLGWSRFEPSLRPTDLSYTPRSMKELAAAFPNKRSLRRTKGISWPQEGEPQDHIRHLFIDLGDQDQQKRNDFNKLYDLLERTKGVGSWDYSPETRLVWGMGECAFASSDFYR